MKEKCRSEVRMACLDIDWIARSGVQLLAQSDLGQIMLRTRHRGLRCIENYVQRDATARLHVSWLVNELHLTRSLPYVVWLFCMQEGSSWNSSCIDEFFA